MTDAVPQANQNKLFVGNLPFNTTEQELQELFAQFGEIVEIKLITDRMTGRSKGIAFVEFASEDQAAQAIEGTNGTQMQGRDLVVNVARPFVPRERNFDDRGGSGMGGGGGRRPSYGNNRGGSGGGRSGGSRY
ncbi:MAG: RNA-binding protein [bacterium]|nr:RNA-binding protein [bacterium]